jgi:hypothetical protein
MASARMNVYTALLGLILFSGLTVMQRNIIFHTELENDIKDFVTSYTAQDGNQQISYSGIQDSYSLWKWLEFTFDAQYNDDDPPQSEWVIQGLNDSKTDIIYVPMSFQPIQSVNVITAIYMGRSKYSTKVMPGLRGAMRSNMWIQYESETMTHNQYTLQMPENSEPENDDALPDMIKASLNQTHSQFFFLNSIPKNKTMKVLEMLKEGEWINDVDTETVFFKLNVFNPNLKRLAQVSLLLQ